MRSIERLKSMVERGREVEGSRVEGIKEKKEILKTLLLK